MKKLAAALLAAALLVLPAQAVSGAPTVDAAAAVLMEKETGAILYEQNAHDKLEPASVTKVMTLLLVLGACAAVGGNVVTDAFGVVALVAMAPLIAIQVMGLVYVHRSKAVPQPAADLAEDTVVNIEEDFE